MADWDSCYYTYDPQYQAGQLDVFYHMFQKVIFSTFFIGSRLVQINKKS